MSHHSPIFPKFTISNISVFTFSRFRQFSVNNSFAAINKKIEHQDNISMFDLIMQLKLGLTKAIADAAIMVAVPGFVPTKNNDGSFFSCGRANHFLSLVKVHPSYGLSNLFTHLFHTVIWQTISTSIEQ